MITVKCPKPPKGLDLAKNSNEPSIWSYKPLMEEHHDHWDARLTSLMNESPTMPDLVMFPRDFELQLESLTFLAAKIAKGQPLPPEADQPIAQLRTEIIGNLALSRLFRIFEFQPDDADLETLQNQGPQGKILAEPSYIDITKGKQPLDRRLHIPLGLLPPEPLEPGADPAASPPETWYLMVDESDTAAEELIVQRLGPKPTTQYQQHLYATGVESVNFGEYETLIPHLPTDQYLAYLDRLFDDETN